jgi:beta-aspartyl-peptidase (threonine type)
MRLLLRPFLLILAAMSHATAADPTARPNPFGLVLHGGAGVIDRRNLTPEKEAELRAKLTEAREAGYAVLQRGGPALDAVIATITILEDSPLFNAGKGAVFNHDGICELDASIMDGRTQAAGAIAGVRRIRNPITLARAVMEKSSHVLLSGEGAEKFAAQQGFAFVPNEYFQTEARRRQWEQALQREAGGKTSSWEFPDAAQVDRTGRYGTVGCVALDQAGNLAAGTSTGGMTNKKFGRIGDAPIIGAGTYASNATCAVSATGWGEFFIRVGVARDIAAQLEYRGTPLAEAAAATMAKVGKLGGDGGVICLDRQGNIALPFNSAGMYRAYRLSDGRTGVAMYAEEK